MSAGVGELPGLLESAEHVFVYGFQTNEVHDAVLQALSSNRLVRTRSLSEADAKLHVAADHPEWCFQFSGLCAGSADPARENSFVEAGTGGALPALIRIGSQPFFVRGESGTSQLFFLAGGELADLDENVTRYCSGLKWFCGLIPLMMVLRGALKERVWHNDHPRACFIIDDPLLKRRHGFLEYQRLMESLRRQRFSACIAFIPWNYRRSSRKVVELFSSNPESASLCVHGCDHTKAEFERGDVGLLRGKARLALERMRLHEQLSGLSFDDVMVFPQGLFSAEAMSALKAAGYLAAVNSELGPSTVCESLSIRDLLDVAVTRYSDFPLFGRRYPNDLAEFAFDLFLGKPALAVGHHNYFKDGNEALETFITRLKALDSRIEWTSLDTICSHACLTKKSDNGDVCVRFYTNRFHLQNTGEQHHRYILQQRHGSGDAAPQVTVDGRRWSYEQEAGDLKIFLSLSPGQTAQIKILSEGSQPGEAPWKPTKTHSVGVLARRILCEVRDNYVDRIRILNMIVSGFRKVVSDRRIQQITAAHCENGTTRRRPL
ncbi:MAG: hypothetical protein LAO23_13035 [Acidobacteriia bacterium]|nr:hypothetical protein [Terriglobia bacterium]